MLYRSGHGNKVPRHMHVSILTLYAGLLMHILLKDKNK